MSDDEQRNGRLRRDDARDLTPTGDREVVDLGEQGLREGDLVDPYLSDHFLDDTEVHIPSGRYRWESGGLDATANAALVGDGGVTFAVEDGSGVDVNVVATEGTVLLKGITQVGQDDDEVGIRTKAESGARVVFDEFNRPDGARNNGNGYGFFVPPSHEGEAYFLNCTVANFTDNGLYASAPQKDGQGRVVVEGGLYANNNISSIRIGSTDSVVRGATVLYDERFNDVVGPNGGRNARGLWVRFGGSGITIEDCDLTYRAAADGIAVPFGIQPRDDAGSGTVRGVRMHNESDRFPILLQDSVADDWTGSGVHLTGSGNLRVDEDAESWIACRSESGGDCETADVGKGVAPPAIQVRRDHASVSTVPGGTVANAFRIGVGADEETLSLNGSVDPPVSEVTVGDVQFAEGDGTVLVATGAPETLAVAVESITGPAEVVVPFDVTVPTDVSQGDSFRIESQVRAGTRLVPIPPTVVRVQDPVARADTDGDGRITTSELNEAISDWAQGVYSLSELRRIIRVWSEDG